MPLVSRSTKTQENVCTPREVLRCAQDDREKQAASLIKNKNAGLPRTEAGVVESWLVGRLQLLETVEQLDELVLVRRFGFGGYPVGNHHDLAGFDLGEHHLDVLVTRLVLAAVFQH